MLWSLTTVFKLHSIDTGSFSISGLPNAVTQDTDSGSATAVVTWSETPTACGGTGAVNVTSNRQSGDAFAIGTNTVTFTATDSLDNVVTASFTVTVEGKTYFAT